ncbi:MAG: tetratricopeptide repeat protein [Magnetococcales bacterium]|nr:tetratricopeptide repeat protein [Magnetococcales bacterium]
MEPVIAQALRSMDSKKKKKNHGHYLTLLTLRAKVARMMGRYTAANLDLTHVMNAQTLRFGRSHATPFHTRVSLAKLRHLNPMDAKRMRRFISGFSRTLKRVARKLGKQHVGILSGEEALANLMIDRGLLQEAEMRLLAVLDKRRAVRSSDDADYATVLHALGRVYLRRGRLDDAEKKLLDARHALDPVPEGSTETLSLQNRYSQEWAAIVLDLAVLRLLQEQNSEAMTLFGTLLKHPKSIDRLPLHDRARLLASIRFLALVQKEAVTHPQTLSRHRLRLQASLTESSPVRVRFRTVLDLIKTAEKQTVPATRKEALKVARSQLATLVTPLADDLNFPDGSGRKTGASTEKGRVRTDQKSRSSTSTQSEPVEKKGFYIPLGCGPNKKSAMRLMKRVEKFELPGYLKTVKRSGRKPLYCSIAGPFPTKGDAKEDLTVVKNDVGVRDAYIKRYR